MGYHTIKRRRRFAKIRRVLAPAQGHKCFICGEALDESATMEHVIPRAKGGKRYRNISLSHIACNEAKADQMPTGCDIIRVQVLWAASGLE